MKRITFALTAGVAVLTTLLLAGIASAHAPIAFITWDADTNPTTLTASTDERAMETGAGTFYLRVYNAGGARVDNGDAAVSDDTYSITVTLQPNLPAGSYRVDWLTTSVDGAVLSGSESVPLPGGIAPSEEDEEAEEHDAGEEPAAGEEQGEEQAPGTAAPVTPPSTGDAGLVDQQARGFGSLAAVAVATVIAAAGGLAYAARRRA